MVQWLKDRLKRGDLVGERVEKGWDCVDAVGGGRLGKVSVVVEREIAVCCFKFKVEGLMTNLM